MSIIIQTGHSSSFSNKLMEEFYIRGLSRPLTSYSYKLSANEITHMLVQTLSREGGDSLKSKIADNLVIDFQLSNLDNNIVLGWEDEKNLVILDFFKKAELGGKFILIFDNPKYIFQDINFKELSIDNGDQMLTDWLIYHRSLLSFYEKNKSICLLLEGRACFENFNQVTKELITFEPNMKLKSSWQVVESRSNDAPINELDAPLDLLSNLLIKQYPEIIQVYNAMLDLSKVKNSQPIYKSKNPSKEDIFSSLKIVAIKLSEKSEELKKYNNLLIKKLEDTQKLLEDNKKNTDNQQNKVLSKNGDDVEDLEAKNRKLIFQLTEAYESIEKLSKINEINTYPIHNDNILLKKDFEQLLQGNNSKSDLESISPKGIKTPYIEESGLYGAEQRVKLDLPYRLGSTIVNSTKSRKEMLLLPLYLFSEYNDYKKNEKEKGALPPLEAYQDREKGEKVKSHLSYQLGKRVTKISYSPISLLENSFGVLKDIYKFKKNS